MVKKGKGESSPETLYIGELGPDGKKFIGLLSPVETTTSSLVN